MSIRDKVLGRKEAVKALRTADRQLRDHKATDENDATYQQLNIAANAAAKDVPWWRR